MWKLISQEGLFNPSFKINSNLRAASSKFGCRKLYKVEVERSVYFAVIKKVPEVLEYLLIDEGRGPRVSSRRALEEAFIQCASQGSQKLAHIIITHRGCSVSRNCRKEALEEAQRQSSLPLYPPYPQDMVSYLEEVQVAQM